MRPIWWRATRHDASRAGQDGAEAGFTLAEMLVVLVIMALAAGLVVGHGLPGSDGLLRASLGDWLRQTRDHAMQSGRPLGLRVGDSGHDLVADDGSRLDFGPQWAVTLQPEGNSLRFDPDGSSDGGGVTLASPDRHLILARVAPEVGTVTTPLP